MLHKILSFFHLSHHTKVYLSFLIFGLASWIFANSIFIEVSAFLTRVPEGKDISFYILIALQLSNFLPMYYMFASYYNVSSNTHNNNKNNKAEREIVKEELNREIHMIWFILILGLLSSFGVGFGWQVVYHERYSIMLFVTIFTGGIVGSMSSILFYGFVSSYPSTFTSALATGEGCSGIIAAVLGILQDAGNPHELGFNILTFFGLISCIFIMAMMAFQYLLSSRRGASSSSSSSSPYVTTPEQLEEHQPLLALAMDDDDDDLSVDHSMNNSLVIQVVWKKFWKPLVLQFVISALSYGIIPALLPLFCLKYPNGSEILKWSSSLSMCLDPLSRITTGWVRWYDRIEQGTICVIVLALVIFYEAIFCPASSLLFTSMDVHGLLPIVLNCALVSCAGYTQTMIYLTIKRQQEHDIDKSGNLLEAYEWCGFSVQIGGMTGALISYIILLRFNP